MNTLGELVSKVEEHGIGMRKDFPQATIRLYATFLSQRRSCSCPISGRRIVGQDGVLLAGAECDHFYSRSYNAIGGGWLIDSNENKKLRNPAYRASVNTLFLAFQQELAQWMESRGTGVLFSESD